MEQFLPFHIPDIGEEEIESVVATLRSGWLTTGSKVRQFEQEFAERIGSSYAVAVNSCTAALHLALEAIGITEGDEVIVPTMTFAATAEVVRYFKAKPVLVDCRWDTLTIDVDQIEKAITPKTKAIIPVHFAGQPCEMDRILEIAHMLQREGYRRCGSCPSGSVRREDDRKHWGYHLLFVLRHQIDHHR